MFLKYLTLFDFVPSLKTSNLYFRKLQFPKASVELIIANYWANVQKR